MRPQRNIALQVLNPDPERRLSAERKRLQKGRIPLSLALLGQLNVHRLLGMRLTVRRLTLDREEQRTGSPGGQAAQDFLSGQ
jgi:hypothetical protein